jgi:PAS domain S-box-containing protein
MDDRRSVGQSGRNSRFLERVGQACAGVSIAIALLALTGWATGRLILASFHADFIPLSPTSALAFLLLGETLLVSDRQRAHPRSRWLAGAATTLVLLIGLLILGQHLTGADLGLERWLSRSSATFGQVPIGRMSPLTAGTFVVASLAMLTLLASPVGWRLAREAAVSAAVGVMAVGFLVALGYWRGVAFLSGGSLIPIALPGALAFIFLGAGILAVGGPRFWTVRDYRPVAVGFTVGLAAAIFLFALATWQERDRIHEEFERKAQALAFDLHDVLRDNSEDLANIQSLYAISRIVGRDAFHAFVSQIMARHPNIQAFSWSPYVTDRERADYEVRARRDGFASYQFTERSSDGRLVPARRRPAYVPVFYQEPYTGNEATLGFDNLSDPARRATLEKARDTGQAVATGPISLVQGTSQTVGILIYQSVYQAGKPIATLAQRQSNVRGFVVEVLSLDRLIRTSFPNLVREGLEYRLMDVTATPPEVPIVASTGAERAVRAGVRFDTWFKMADRRWRLEVYAAPWYLASRQSGQAWIVLASGLFLTILLGTYLLASARHTAELARLTDSLRKISRAVEHSPAVVVITDTTGAIEYVNPKFTEVTGYEAEEVQGQNPRILKSGETPPEEYQRLWATITAGEEWRGEFHNRKKNGELFWETASISPVRSPDGHITHFVAIKEDITERKRTEEAARKHALQLEAVRGVSIEITRELDLTAVLHLITERVVELVGGGQGMIRLWDEDSQSLVQKIFTGSGLNQNSAPLRLGEGVAGAAAQRRQGIIVNDFRTSPYAIPHLLDGTRHTAVLAEPLLFGDRVVGVLSIIREAEQPLFTEQNQQLLALFASQAAIAIENARLHESAVQRAQQLASLTRLTQSLVSAISVEKVGEEVMSAVQALMPQAVARLWDVKGDDLATLEVIASAGLQDTRGRTVRFRRGEGLAGEAVISRRPVVSRDLSQDSRFVNKSWAAQEKLVSAILFPLLIGEKIHGILAIFTREPHDFNETEVALFQSLASHAAIAIENVRLQEETVEHGRQLGALLRSTQSIMSGLDLDRTLQTIVREAAAMSGAPVIRLLLLDEDKQLLRFRTGIGTPQEDEEGLVIRMGESFSGQVVATGQPLMVPDTREDPRLIHRRHVDKYGLLSYLGLPIGRDATSIGVLVFSSLIPRAYSEDEVKLLSAFAQQAAIAIENARLHETALRRSTELEALLLSSKAIGSSLELGHVLEVIVQQASAISAAPIVRLFLLDEKNQFLRCRVAVGFPLKDEPDLAIPLGVSFSGQVAVTGEPLAVPDTRVDPRTHYPDHVSKYGVVSYLGLPVKFQDRLLGVLVFNTPAPRHYSADEMAYLSSFASQAAIAMENARLHETAVRRGEQLETIRAVSVEITREMNLGALLHLITDRVVELTGGGQSIIRLWDEVGQWLVPRSYVGRDAHWTDRRLRLGEGVAGTAAQRRQGMIVNDFRTSPYAIPRLTEGSTHTAVLAEPLLFGDRLVGVLSIDREADQQPFAEQDRKLLTLFASQAAIAIENARLHEASIRRGAQLEALLSSLRTVTSGLDLREILDRILGEAIRISGAPHVKVLLRDRADNTLRVGALRGSGMPPADALPAGASLSGLVVQSGEPLFIADAQNDPRNLWRDRDRELGIVTYLGLPIKKGVEILGVLTFNTTSPYQYTPEEMILLTSFAAQAAIAIEHARLYEEISQHAETLEARVQERTTELAQMNLELTAALRQAEAGNQAKSDFLINMSHELRTPLNAILGFAQILQGQAKEGLSDKQRRYLDNIYNSGRHLLAIVNEILDLNTAEAKELALHLTKVNLAEVITEVLEATREAVRQKGLSVHALIPPDLPVFDADRDRIRQIAICLLSNAVKFTPAGGSVRVTASRISDLQFPISDVKDIGPGPQSQIANQESQMPPPRLQIANQESKIGDFLEIAVADTGIGIRPEDLPRLFHMFGQLDSPLTKRYAGTGVGLALAKRLVELHGGRITASSEGEGKGSTFTVRFPLDGPTGTAEE